MKYKIRRISDGAIYRVAWPGFSDFGITGIDIIVSKDIADRFILTSKTPIEAIEVMDIQS